MQVRSLFPSVVAVAMCLSFTIPEVASTATSANTQHKLAPASADLLDALRTANEFLLAWAFRDADRGVPLISGRLRAQVGDDSWLRQFVVGLSNPHHHAFEIGPGQKQGVSRYVFRVTLYELYTGEPRGTAYPGAIELAREGGVWRVDRLPRSSDNP
jgi:hypothetical protein